MGKVNMIVKIAVLLPVVMLHACPDANNNNKSCCSVAEPVNFSDDNEHDVSSGSCEFDNSLCSYSQGCVDPLMSNWTSMSGYAYATQTTNGEFESYTVLTSPLLSVRHDACFHINYSVHSPANVDGFFEFNNSDHDVKKLFDRISQGTSVDHKAVTTTVISQWKRSLLYGRIMIRARGGGLGGSYVKLFSISIVEGRCEGQQCNFDKRFCRWSKDCWSSTSSVGPTDYPIISDPDNSDMFAYLKKEVCTLTTKFTRASSPQTDCLTFKFILRGTNTSLNVSVQLSDGESRTLWSFTQDGDSHQQWTEGVLPISVPFAYRILFSGQRPQSATKIVALDSVNTTRTDNCTVKPPRAATGATFPFTTQPTSTTERRQTSPSKSTGVDQTSSPTDSLLGDSSPSNGPAIGGAVAGVLLLIVIVVLIVVVVVWRRRRVKRNPPDDDTLKKGGTTCTPVGDKNQDYAEIRASHFYHSTSQPEDDYTEIDGITAQDDFHPYDLAQEGVADNPGASGRSNHSKYVNTLESPRPDGIAQYTNTVEDDYSCPDTGNDEYHHIRNPQTSMKPAASGTKDNYHHIRNPQTSMKPAVSGTKDDYHHIRNPPNSLKAGVGRTKDDYNHIGNPTNICSPDASQTADDYHHIDSFQNSQQSDVNGANDGYHHIGNHKKEGHATSEPSATIVVDETKNKQASQPKLNHGYSLVRNRDEKPQVAPKPRQPRNDYFILEPDGNQTHEESSDSISCDPDNRIDKDPDTVEVDTAGCTTQPRAEAVPDDYNVLSFNEARKQSAKKHGVAPKAYDHVSNNPDDDYSETQTGKRTIVVDSDYDHVQL